VRLFNFFAMIHPDRFGDLAILTKDQQVIVEPYSVGDDGLIQVYVRGEAADTLKLDQSIRRLPWLATAPVLEVSE
jgi:hypothetical protein